MIEYKKARKFDDLLVVKKNDQTMIMHKDSPSDGILCLLLSDFNNMDSPEILNRFNAHIDKLMADIENDRPIEIEDGQPQLRWSKECQAWLAEGDVLRCEVAWDSNAESEDGLGAVAIKIDDRLLSGQEFLELLEVFEGFGMRIEFMHQNRLTNPPEPILQKTRKVKEPAVQGC
jgi:hypothetical protein